jgi:AcrR family transcriptional regulator
MVASGGRERRRIALRETIVEAARAIVRDEGIRALSMRRIGDAIGYAPASLYAHFASREALLTELCREGFSALRSALEDASSRHQNPRTRLLALAAAYVQFAVEHPETYRLIFMEDSRLTKGVFESLDSDDGARAFGLLVAPLVELRATGAIRRSADPARLADLLWTVVHGLASLRLACTSVPASEDGALLSLAVATILEGSRPASKGRAS